MKGVFPAIVVIIVLTIIGRLYVAQMPDPDAVRVLGTVRGQVLRVSDGDTIVILCDGRNERIRLWGVDCPESGQAGGLEAKHFTEQEVQDMAVDVEVVDVDQYGRLVGIVTLAGTEREARPRQLNTDLLSSGWAWWYRRYAPGRRDFGQLEAKARKARLGVWRDPDPVAPWVYRDHKGEAYVSPMARD